VGLKLNGTHQLLVYADDMNILNDNIDAIKKNIQTLIKASQEVHLKVTTKKSIYMLLSHHQNSGQKHGIKIGKRWFENVAQFKYFGTTVSNQNLISEEIKRGLHSGNSVQKHLSSRLLSKHINLEYKKL
jgi:hypothetical protein